MDSIHPHWQSDDGEQAVPVRGKEAVETPQLKGGKTVSRRPAAIVGMSIVIGLGFIFFHGVDQLTGQVANQKPGVSVQITEAGFIPSRLEVEHGQTITWRNEQDTPHVVESDTLCSDTGFCLQTTTLFRGDSDNFTITLDMQPGIYTYFSSVVDGMVGEIVIMGGPDEFTDIRSVLEDDLFNQPAGVPTAVPPPPAQVPYAANIPSNPYTIDSERIHPFDGGGEPIPEAFGDDPRAPPPALTGSRRPLRQPETGPGIWVAVAASIGFLFAGSRNTRVVQTLDEI